MFYVLEFLCFLSVLCNANVSYLYYIMFTITYTYMWWRELKCCSVIFEFYIIICICAVFQHFPGSNLSIVKNTEDDAISEGTERHVNSPTMDLNDDLSSSQDRSSSIAETRSFHDRPVDANMVSREHYLQYGVRIVDWTIYFWSSLCYLMNGLDLMKGRRLGPKRIIDLFSNFT